MFLSFLLQTVAGTLNPRRSVASPQNGGLWHWGIWFRFARWRETTGCGEMGAEMTCLTVLRLALRMTQGSRWCDDLDQPGGHIINESGHQPVAGKGWVRLEGSHIDRHRGIWIGDRFGCQCFLVDAKVARQQGWLPLEVRNPALGVLKHDQVKLAGGRDSFLLADPTQHPHSLQGRGSDAPPHIADHDRLSWLEAKKVSRIDARIHTANDHGPQGRHHG
nr:hypothetical protein [Ktedonospora formicarum]